MIEDQRYVTPSKPELPCGVLKTQINPPISRSLNHTLKDGGRTEAE